MQEGNLQPKDDCTRCPDVIKGSCFVYQMMESHMMDEAYEINDLRDYLQNMHNDDTVEQAYDIYREKAIRYEELAGEEFRPE